MNIPIYFARRFVAGKTAEEAIEVVQNLNQQGIVASLDLLGENVSTHAQADEAVNEYEKLFSLISSTKVQSGVSLKLTQLGLDLGEKECLDRMRKVLKLAQERNLFVRIDMEGSNYTESTLRVFQQLHREFHNVGIVLQAYLHRSLNDAKRLAAEKASVRVCKGAYKEPASVALQDMDRIRAQYKDMVKLLLEQGCKIGIATHDENLIEWSKKFVTEENYPKNQFEFQMLYGLRRKKSAELVRQGFRVRSYVPYGTHWFPYFYRRLRERKENVLFVLKSLIFD